MSLKTWKAEFYPVEASDVSEGDAIDHSIRKWEGLSPENLEKHDLWWRGTYSLGRGADDSVSMVIASSTCALCFHHESTSCDGCPLKESRGIRCDGRLSHEHYSPFGMWLSHGEPASMIYALQVAKAHVASQKADQ